jgi:hypothetical protein
VRALQPLILNQPTRLAVVVGPDFHRMHRLLKERKKKQKRKKGCYYYLSILLRVLGDSNTIRGALLPSFVTDEIASTFT